MLVKRDELHKTMQRHEVEEFLKNKGDFVKIDLLTRFMKQHLPTETRRFVCLLLAELYEERRMFSEAARMYNSAAINTVSFKEQGQHYIDEALNWIRVGKFTMADEAEKKAIVQLNPKERKQILEQYVNMYRQQAMVYLKEKRIAHALRVYEKIITMGISDLEKHEIQEVMLKMYDRLGRIREYMVLKKSLE